jgi:methyl-accepting chemotaxis protein
MKPLKDASVGAKVALAPLLAMVCLVAVAALGLWTARQLTRTMHSLQSTSLQSLATMAELQRRLGSAFASTNQSLAWTGAEFPAARIDALDKAVAKELSTIEGLLDRQASLHGGDAASQAQIQEIHQTFKKFQRAALDALDMKSTGLSTAATFIQAVGETYRKLDVQIEAMAESLHQAAGAQVKAAAADSEAKSWVIAAAGLVALLISAVTAWWCARLIVQPLRDAQRVASDVAQGDLTVRELIGSGDETGRVLAALVEVTRNLNGIVTEVRRTADQVSGASGEIASGNADLSARTESAAAAIQEAAAAIEELATTIRSSADNAREANKLAHEASAVAREGGAVVTDVVGTMEAINAQAKKIGEIIGVIDGIAFQTNILALNAAVEAARAGEQGRGFSVVATEVRTLAQRSAEAAREIRTLISSSVEQIDVGTGKVQAAGRTMGRVVGAIEQVARTVADISRASAEQASGIAQVNQTVAEMDRSTQQNAAMVEQASAATEALRQQAASLVHSLERFTTS